jgi:hypothetical protein
MADGAGVITWAEFAPELIGALFGVLLFVLGILGWALKRLIGKLDAQVETLETDVNDVHDRLLIMETNYKHCCGKGDH